MLLERCGEYDSPFYAKGEKQMNTVIIEIDKQVIAYIGREYERIGFPTKIVDTSGSRREGIHSIQQLEDYFEDLIIDLRSMMSKYNETRSSASTARKENEL